jgi:hypothetical protein
MKQTTRPIPNTLEEIYEDPDIGLGEYGLPEPMLVLPDASDPLYVEKPIDKYEPPENAATRNHNRVDHDENKLVKKKWKTEPTTQAEIKDCNEELTGDQLQRITAGP